MLEIARVKQKFFSCQTEREAEELLEAYPMLQKARAGFYAQLSQAMLLCQKVEEYALLKALISRYHLSKTYQWLPDAQKQRLKVLAKAAESNIPRVCRIYAISEVMLDEQQGGWHCFGLFTDGTTLERTGIEGNSPNWADLTLQSLITSTRMGIACGYKTTIPVVVRPTAADFFHLRTADKTLPTTAMCAEVSGWEEFLSLKPLRVVQFQTQANLLDRMGLEKALSSILCLIETTPQ